MTPEVRDLLHRAAEALRASQAIHEASYAMGTDWVTQGAIVDLGAARRLQTALATASGISTDIDRALSDETYLELLRR